MKIFVLSSRISGIFPLIFYGHTSSSCPWDIVTKVNWSIMIDQYMIYFLLKGLFHLDSLFGLHLEGVCSSCWCLIGLSFGLRLDAVWVFDLNSPCGHKIFSTPISSPNWEWSYRSLFLLPPFLDGDQYCPNAPFYTATSPYREINSLPINT